jgi:hypothetical protein
MAIGFMQLAQKVLGMVVFLALTSQLKKLNYGLELMIYQH